MNDISAFLTKILEPNFEIPVEANFVIGIQNLQSVIQNLDDRLDEFSDNRLSVWPGNWQTIDSDDIFLANGVTIPGEKINAKRGTVAETSGGLLTGPILTGRQALGNLEISFLETNESFIDFVIRPWIVATAHYGLYARDKNSTQNFKRDIFVYFYDRRNVTRKFIKFINAAPIDVASFEAIYGATGKSAGMRTAKVTWTYSNYSVI